MGLVLGMLLWMGGIGLLVLRVSRGWRAGFQDYAERYLASADAQLRASDVYMTPDQLFRLSWLSALLGAFSGILMAFGGSPLRLVLLAVVLGSLAFHVPNWALAVLAYRRRMRFETQLPDGIDLLSRSVKTGHSLAEAFSLGARELPNPIAQEYGLVVRDTQNNRSLVEASRRLAERMAFEDTRLLAIVIELGMQEGGNMTDALSAVAETVRNRFNVRRKVRAATASARAQLCVVASMPFIMFGMFAVTNPEMMAPMWSSNIGWLLLGIVVFLEAMGILVMIRTARRVEY